MFSQACVILFTWGGLPQCMLGYHPMEQTPPPPGSRHTHTPGAEPPRADTPPPGADIPPPNTEHAGRYGQRAGGTHPTGMQSCLIIFLA